MRSESRGQSSNLRHYLAVLRRRAPVVALVTAAVTAAALGLSLLQKPLYQASAEVLISRQNLAASLTNTVDPSAYQQPDRVIQTQARLAREPTVASRALQTAGIKDRTASGLLGSSDVVAEPNIDLLQIHVRDRDPRIASLLATGYARAFVQYRRELDTQALRRARLEVEQRMADLRRSKATRTRLYTNLVDNDAKLRTLETLATSNALVVRRPSSAAKVQPKPVRNTILGIVFGGFLGLLAAFVVETLDTRVRSDSEVASRLGLPLLGRLPRPRRQLGPMPLVMLDDPHGSGGEAFRILRTNIDFVNLERDARTILITSAIESEGKSTTAANLAIAVARAGRSVAVVDIDLRRPTINLFFDLPLTPGMTDVALGVVDLRDALVEVPLSSSDRGGFGETEHVVHVLTAGTVPPNPGEFIAKRAVAEILAQLREQVDVILIDSAPLLHVGDTIALSRRVDGIIVVARLRALNQTLLTELARVLETTPATALGVVLTDAEEMTSYGYGGYVGDPRRRPARMRIGRR